MTKEKLEQYRNLCKEIKELKQEINSIRRDTTTKDSVTGSSPHYPYTVHQIVIEGVDQEHRPIIEALQKQLQRANDQRISIETYIADIADSQIRHAIRLKYIQGYSWQRVATELGYQDESTPRQKIEKFLLLPENPESSDVK